jgi:hypothetical protein
MYTQKVEHSLIIRGVKMPPSKGQRVRISLNDKMEIINLVEKGIDREEVRKKFGLKYRSNIQRILEKKEVIKERFNSMKKSHTKRAFYVRQSNYPNLEEALLIWIKQMRGNRVPLSTQLILKKASDFVALLGYEKFMASNGYFQRFKSRWRLSFATERGESESVNEDVMNGWKQKLQEMLKDVDLKNTYNVDESGLFWRLMPNKTYVLRNENRKCQKKFADRITLLLLTNVDGSDKQIAAVGKSKSPHCFRGIKKLPLDYYSQRNAWMDSRIFLEIVTKFNKRMKKEKRNVLLFIDNFSGHLLDNEFSNVKIVYLPANTTSLLQPLD